MPSPLINYRQFHEKLGLFIKAFGYYLPDSNIEGYCYGLSWMGIYAYLGGHFENFLRRLIFLNQISPTQLMAQIDRARKKCKDKKILSFDDLFILEIPAFFDGVAAIQAPHLIMQGKDTFTLTKQYALNQQTVFLSELTNSILPISLIPSGGVCIEDLGFFCFTKEELIHFFTKLNETLQIRPIQFALLSATLSKEGGHATFFIYHPYEQAWQFFDVEKQNYLDGSLPLWQDSRTFANCFFAQLRPEFVGIYFTAIGKKNEHTAFIELKNQFSVAYELKLDDSFTREKVQFLEEFFNHLDFSPVFSNTDITLLDRLHRHKLLGENQLLANAISIGNSALVTHWLKLKLSIPRDALTRAAARGDVSLMDVLLKNGGELGTDEYGEHPLTRAIMSGHMGMISFLMGKFPDPKNIIGGQGRNLLHAAVISGSLDCVAYILPFKIGDLDKLTSYGMSALEIAIGKGFYVIAEFLVNHGVYVRKETLNLVAKLGKLDMLKLCLSVKGVLDLSHGIMLMHQAAKYGQDRVIHWLLQEGIDVNDRGENDFHSALSLALAYQGSRTTIALLLKHHAVLSPKDHSIQLTLLHIAAENGRTDLMPWLLGQFPKDINQKTSDGRTPLRFAVINGNIDLCHTLVAAGCLITEEDIESAIQRQYLEIAWMLAEKHKQKNNSVTLFLSIFKRTLPYLTNAQIIHLFDQLSDLSYAPFAFIHQHRHVHLDRLHLFFSRPRVTTIWKTTGCGLPMVSFLFEFSGPIWQTKAYREIAYAMSNKFVENLSKEKMPPNWKTDRKTKAFIDADFGNFFRKKSNVRKNRIQQSIQHAAPLNHDGSEIGVSPRTLNSK